MTFLYVIIALVLVFDFINGFHDSANSIANVVSTKVLSPFAAVSAAAFFNFIAFTVFPMKVAHTIGAGVVDTTVLNMNVIGAALIAAIAWNLFTWWLGLPSSSSHTIVGGLIGAAVAKAGFSAVLAPGVIKIVLFIFIAPLMGMVIGHGISTLIMWICKRFSPSGVDKVFRRLQLVSSSALSLGHGGNDAQKSMGIIWLALVLSNLIPSGSEIPFWVKISCQIAIALGTLFGGWRIVKTMGQRITKIKPFEGFSAETAGSITLFIATHFGIPVSTTHTITGAIIGVGARRGVSAVRWGVTRKIMWAWVLTIPISGIIGALMYLFFSTVHPL
jgi:inorganic phosphate transporter, PiT family